MTSASKSVQIRDLTIGAGRNLTSAAKILGAGWATLGLQAAGRGYGLARNRRERRKARRSASQNSSSRTTKIVVAGAVVGVVAGGIAIAAKRRHTPPPPADAPPSLDDYADLPH